MKYFEKLKIIAAFAAHILAALTMFCLVGLAALALHLVREFMAKHGVEPVVLYGMEGLELLLFACDLVATCIWAVKSTAHFIEDFKE